MKKTKIEPVELVCHASEARQVFAAGTFNEWSPDAMPLVRDKAGSSRSSLKMPSGDHEFKFLVDCQWRGECDDRNCPERGPNEFGPMKRVVEVR